MPKIFKYQKVTDEFTTRTLVEPDYRESEDRITELCNLSGEIYVSIPDSVILPAQPDIIAQTLSEVTLTDELKDKIKKTSPHIQLVNQRVRDKIAEKYSVNDEIKALRERDKDKVQFDEYDAYVEECIAWGETEKIKLGVEKAK